MSSVSLSGRVAIASAGLLIVGEVMGGTLRVPQDHATIQGAIDAAVVGDIVDVAAGTYSENLVVAKTGVIIQGSGVGVSTIQPATATNPVIKFQSPTDRTVVFRGFTITGGSGNQAIFGGGIDITDASPTLTALDVFNNSSQVLGGGIAVKGSKSDPLIFANTIRSNRGSRRGGGNGEFGGFGGGIFVGNLARGVITNNTITDNDAWSLGGAIFCGSVSDGGNLIPNGASPLISDNTIFANKADFHPGIVVSGTGSCPAIQYNVLHSNLANYQSGAGVALLERAGGFLINNTIVGTQATSGGLAYGVWVNPNPDNRVEIFNNIIASNENVGLHAPAVAVLDFNLIHNHPNGAFTGGASQGAGFLSLDPMFVNAGSDDYRLAGGSPAIDSGDPDPSSNDSDGSRNDRGAFGGAIPTFFVDRDRDGLSDADEIGEGTSAINPDHDGDGVLDGEEVHLYGTNPLNPNSDGDDPRATDGIEIEVGTNPNGILDIPIFSVAMTFANLRQRAFDRSQVAFVPQAVEPVAALDPPRCGGLPGEGMVFQEELAIQVSNLADRLNFYAQAKPRAGLTTNKVSFYVDDAGSGSYDLTTFDDARVDFSDGTIQPPIDGEVLPIGAKYLSKLVVGHSQSGFGFPQFFDIGGSGYIRFNGHLPQTVGASFRVATRKVFVAGEDFPEIREMYFKIVNSNVANVLALVEAEGFTGAMSFDLAPGPESTMDVASTWFARVGLDAETGLGPGFSSMFWKDERDTTGDSNDEAHDTDWLVVGYDLDSDGVVDDVVERQINNPAGAGVVVSSLFGADPGEGQPIYWAAENRDRDASHYTAYASAEYATRASYAIEITATDVPFFVRLHEQQTDSEFFDNLVIETTLGQAISAASLITDGIDINYRATAFFPGDGDGDGLSDHLEGVVGTSATKMDTDGDGMADRWELKYRDPIVFQSGLVDSDGDGDNDLTESIAGSDPDDPTSTALKISRFTIAANGDRIIEWSSPIGHDSRVLRATSPDGPFTPVSGWMTSTGGSLTFTDTTAYGERSFYQVESRP